jgi:hypothetical protein
VRAGQRFSMYSIALARFCRGATSDTFQYATLKPIRGATPPVRGRLEISEVCFGSDQQSLIATTGIGSAVFRFVALFTLHDFLVVGEMAGVHGPMAAFVGIVGMVTFYRLD